MTESEYRKAEREMRKRQHLCIQCGKQDAYTLAGRSRCYECAESARAADAKRRENGRNSERMRSITQKRIEAGRCPRCGGYLEPGRKVCKRCIVKTSTNARERFIANGGNWPRGANGFCWMCNKEKAIPGKRLCTSCYDRTMKAQKIATASRDMGAQVWRKYDRAMFAEVIAR